MCKNLQTSLMIILIIGMTSASLADVEYLISQSDQVSQYNWSLEELWTLGGEEETDVPLGYITAVVYQEDKLYILDTKDSKIYVMTIDGQCTEVIDVQGEGPGQCTKPNTLLGLGGDEFVLVKGQPAKLIFTKFYYDYPETRDMLIPEADMYSFTIANSIWNNANVFLAYTESKLIVDRKKAEFLTIKALSTFSREGVELHRYFSQEVGTLNMRMPTEADIAHYSSQDHFAIDAQGYVYVAPDRNEYHVYVFDPDGKLVKIIGRDFESRKRTKDEVVFASYMGQHLGEVFEMEVEKTEADIRAIYLLGSQILLRTSNSEYRLPTGVSIQLDVFDDDQYKAQINILGDEITQRDELRFLSSDLLAVIRGNEDAVQAGIESQVSGYRARAVQVSLYRINRLK